jgi:hypothetical protein
MLDSPTGADWAVSANAPAKKDPNNQAIRVRAFDDTTNEGAGFMAMIPNNASYVTLRTKARGTGTAGSVAGILYRREIPDNAAVGGWFGFSGFSAALPANSFFQYEENSILLSTLGVNAGSLYQFEFVRNAALATDNLTGDWLLAELQLEAGSDEGAVRFYAPNLLVPNSSDWAVNARAGEAADSNNAGLSVRRFDDTTEEGVGLVLFVPTWADRLTFQLKGRAETGPGAASKVATRIYTRNIPDNGAITGWSSVADLTEFDIPSGSENWQYDEQTISLATLGITPGNLSQIEFTRFSAASNNLAGDWSLLELGIVAEPE